MAQSEGFPGYRGTLLYTPKGLQIDRGEKSSLAQGEEPLEIAIAEARYHGARNFR